MDEPPLGEFVEGPASKAPLTGVLFIRQSEYDGGNKQGVKNVLTVRLFEGMTTAPGRGIDEARDAICDSNAVETTRF
jgi:hypothetical protein